MSHNNQIKGLDHHLAQLMDEAATVKEQIRSERERRRQELLERQRMQGLAEVARPRHGHLYTCSLEGPKANVTMRLLISTSAEVRAMAQASGLSISEAADTLITMGLAYLEAEGQKRYAERNASLACQATEGMDPLTTIFRTPSSVG